MRLLRQIPLLTLLAALAGIASVQAGDAQPPLTISLPATSELDKLAELTAQFTGVSIQYNPQKIRGSVRLSVRGQLSQIELWDVFNQVLAGQGFTTVLAGMPAVYQVVPINEASALSAAMDKDDLARLPFQPGYAVVVIDLQFLGAEPTVKALGALFPNQICQVRTLGQEPRKVVIAAPQACIREARALLERLDRPGVVPVVHLFRPKRTAPQSIQTAATSAWGAMGRIGTQPRPAEVQVAPDGAQVVLIANTEDMEQLETLLRNLDEAEPVETRSYRPLFFGIDEVASLLQRLLHADQSSLPNGGVDIVRDGLTNSLIIKATTAQHKRIEEVLKTLDEAPANARRQVRSLPVKHRQVDEVAKLISTLLASSTSPVALGSGGVAQGGDAPAQAGQPVPGTGAPAGSSPAAGTQPNAAGGQPSPSTTANRDNDFMLVADMVTNRLIVMGDPRALDQVQTLLDQLDQRQPQVELEVILVTLSNGQNMDLGVEMVKMVKANQVSGAVTSLFGLSQATSAADPTIRNMARTGLGGIVINPGDFAGVFTALEKVTDARSIIRSRVVANNNAKSTVDGVVQQPLTSNNASTTVSTTSVTGTTDAGTQITITPQITAADYVTLSYTITQSTFLGDSVTTANGTVIPPAKRADNITSVATIPDGFVIALGGLSNRSQSHGESRIPVLGSIPYLGNLFKSSSDSSSDSRFYVFIRADVLRHGSLDDLRHLGTRRSLEAELKETGWPELKPELVK